MRCSGMRVSLGESKGRDKIGWGKRYGKVFLLVKLSRIKKESLFCSVSRKSGSYFIFRALCCCLYRGLTLSCGAICLSH